MIDFHNHILPNIDDGSKSIEMSINMLKEAEYQGITDVVNTVHFQHPKMDGKKVTYDLILKEVEKLQEILDNKGIKIKIHLGSEVFFLPNLVNLKENPICTIGNGKYMLIEFEPNSLPEINRKILFNLKMAGVVPIIAHPERYKKVQNHLTVIDEWIQTGCLIQIEAGSLIGSFGVESRKTAIDIVKHRMCHLIGSDAHNDRGRNFCLKSGIKAVTEISNSNYADQLINNAYKVINGKKIKLNYREYKIEKLGFLEKIKQHIWN